LRSCRSASCFGGETSSCPAGERFLS
jgi:hypothetical protein